MKTFSIPDIRIYTVLFFVIFLNACSMKDPHKISLDGPWLFHVDSSDDGMRQQWYKDGAGREDWTTIQVPDHWDRYNLSGYDGIGWYAKTFDVDSAASWSIVFSGVDDDATVWVNGIRVGSHEGYSDVFYFDVSMAVRPGKNEVVVRVDDRGGPGGIYKPVALTRSDRVDDFLWGKYASFEARRSADWVRDAVIYEVYLRSFSKEGTLKALEKRIPELKQLGVTVVWLMPIHPVGELNRKGTLGSPYAVQDYYAVNPEFGTLEDFKSLVKTVHREGLRIIIDLVANHTAWDSKLVEEHPEWLTKNEEGAIVSPNPDWTDVADLDYDNHELRKYMIEMMKYWVRDVGIDGYRCDVSELVPTDFWDTARRELEKIRPVIMLSEGTFPEHHVTAFDLTYSWNLYDALGKVVSGSTQARVFDDLLRHESYQFPKGSLRMRFNTNHDKNAWEAPAVEKYSPQGSKATALMMFTYPGIPLIYNGEEAGNNKKLNLFEKVNIDWNKGKEFRDFYTMLALLRREHEALRVGTYASLRNTGGPKLYSFVRQTASDTVIVILNLSAKPVQAEIMLPPLKNVKLKEFFSSREFQVAGNTMEVRLPSFGYTVITSQ